MGKVSGRFVRLVKERANDEAILWMGGVRYL